MTRPLFMTLFIFGASCGSHSAPVDEEATIEVTTPSAGWKLKPKAAYETSEAVLCLFELEAPEGMAAQVISKVQSSIMLDKTEKPIKRFVLGKTWSWNSDPGIAFIDSTDEIAELIADAKRIDKPQKP